MFCPEFSSLTGEMMSNWMGVSGATRASNERTERAGDGSEPTELMLLARPVRPLLDPNNKEKTAKIITTGAPKPLNQRFPNWGSRGPRAVPWGSNFNKLLICYIFKNAYGE